MRTLTIAALLVGLGLAGGLAIVYSGVFDVAASEPNLALEEWVLSTAMEHSVRRHARDLPVPDSLGDEERAREGFAAYEDMCQGCHGAPGVDPDVVGQGLNPSPPELDDAAHEWSPGELFWITKHGVKMTGMPAFGPTHDDEELWDLVAFLNRLPELSADDYRRMRSPTEGAERPSHSHHPSHAHPD